MERRARKCVALTLLSLLSLGVVALFAGQDEQEDEREIQREREEAEREFLPTYRELERMERRSLERLKQKGYPADLDGLPGKDQGEAAHWLLLKAENGDADAQAAVGLAYYRGEGLPQDHEQAVNWLRKAAKSGHAQAQTNLAVCYVQGHGVKRDEQEAVKWFQSAAEQGNAAAQANLGICFFRGQGVTKDLVRAYMWLDLAAEGELEVAHAFRDQVAANMTSEQIREAEKLVRTSKEKR